MASDRLYQQAFAYKKEKLWKTLYDSEVFAVRLPDGEIGYCSVMGFLGEHIALGLYVGAKGFDSYRKLASGELMVEDEDNFSEFPAWLLAQDCLQCSFENKDDLRDGEADEVRRYTRAHHINLRGPNSFPQFSRYTPNHFPWKFTSPLDEERMGEALEAATALSQMLEHSEPEALGLSEIDGDTVSVPLLTRQGKTFVLSRTDLPAPPPEEYPTPKEIDSGAAAKLRKLKKGGILECEILRLPEPVQEDPEEAPVLPAMLLCVDASAHIILPMEPVTDYDERPEHLLDAFVRGLLASGSCPPAVRVRDAAARALLEGFCARAGILLSMDEDLPVLDDVKEDFFSFMADREDDEEGQDRMFEQLMEMSDKDLASMPEPLADQLLSMAGMGLLPPELEWRLKMIFQR